MKWISTKDRLPEDEQEILFCEVDPYPEENPPGYRIGYGVYDADNNYIAEPGDFLATQMSGVTHWMPMPDPPEAL